MNWEEDGRKEEVHYVGGASNCVVVVVPALVGGGAWRLMPEMDAVIDGKDC